MPAILHLEDDARDHKLIAATLKRDGLEAAETIRCAATESEFRVALAECRFDLILSDYNLRGFDGLTALRVAQDVCPSTPVLIVSGAMGETAAVELLKAGATDVVLKDKLELLAPAIRRALGEAAERRARQAAEARLRDSESRLRAMFESVRDYAIFSIDTRGRVMSWNVGAERLFGYSESEIVGRDANVIFTADDLAAGLPASERETAISKGQADVHGLRIRKDGSTFIASVVVTPIIDDHGVLQGFTKVARDVTERVRYEEQLRSARDAAEAASRAKDDFLAVLSHELRTPLTPVLTMAQLKERDPQLAPPLREAFTMIRRNIELEARLIDDLLDLTRVSRGKMEFNFTSVDLDEQARHVIGMVADEARGKGVALTADLTTSPSQVRADAARLQQLMWNLIKNAIKFTPGGGTVHVTTQLDLAANELILQVRDTGIGIAPQMLPKLFDPFQQGGSDVTRLFGGLGLGLTISRGIADQHGGLLSAHSEGPGRGATLTLKLPLLKPASSPKSVVEPGHIDGFPDAGAAAVNGDVAHAEVACRVLLVEDNPDTLGVMSMVLKMAGFEVRTAGSVSAALKSANAEPPDLIISDIGLPDGSGLDLMRQIRNQRQIPGIALSGYGMEEDVRRSHDAGFVAHVTKPIDITRLEEVVKHVVAEHCVTR